MHEVQGIGEGPTKREAEKAAAASCLQQLKDLNIIEDSTHTRPSSSPKVELASKKRKISTSTSLTESTPIELESIKGYQCLCKSCKGGKSCRLSLFLTTYVYFIEICLSGELEVGRDHITYDPKQQQLTEGMTLSICHVKLKVHPEGSASKPYKVHW